MPAGTSRGEKASTHPEVAEQLPEPPKPARGKSNRRGTLVDTYL
jgi:hypothetical protein